MSNGLFEDDLLVWLLAHEYNFAPYEPLKYERVLPVNSLGSHFLANTSNVAKCHVQYDPDEVLSTLVVGDPCTACWAAGKQWEEETVPKYVFCSLSGFEDPVEFLNTVFEPGEPVKMGVYMLEQKNAPDCTYEYLSDTVEIIWTPDDVTSTLVVTTKPDNIIRMDASAGGCFKQFKQNGTRAEINCC